MANRKQARAIAKRIKADPKEVKTVLQAEGLMATRFAVDGYSVAVAMVLWDEGNRDKEQLHTTMGRISKLFDEINSGYVSIEDCKKTLEEEADFRIE
jgi:GTP cyclohydrolase I